MTAPVWRSALMEILSDKHTMLQTNQEAVRDSDQEVELLLSCVNCVGDSEAISRCDSITTSPLTGDGCNCCTMRGKHKEVMPMLINNSDTN